MSFLPLLFIHPQVNKLDKNDLEETMRNPWKADRSVFITDWLVLGAIPINSINELDKDFFADKNGEENIRPTEGDSVNISGKEFKWTKLNGVDKIDLLKFCQGGRTEDAVAYAYSKIIRKEAGRVYFYLGSDDGVKVWLNGKLIHRIPGLRMLQMDEDAFVGDMAAGENHLLLKIGQGKGGWGYVVRMMENRNLFNTITGNIEFTLTDIDSLTKTLRVVSEESIDQSLFKQAVNMEVYTSGGKTVTEKTFDCSQPVILNYKNWEDGPYEFRFTYKDIKGTKQVKYLSWYKGDILTEANKIVNSAPDKNIRTPEASLHRMLADMILDKLGNNLKNPDSANYQGLISPIMEFEETQSGQQIRPGGFIRLTYIDEIDNTPQFCKCYLPINYDPSKKWPMVIFLHGAIQNIPEYYKIWEADKRHEDPADLENVIYIEPHGRGNTSYRGIGDRDVLKCIELAKQKLNIDDDRVYLMGMSMGGFGTWNVATRHPGLFAAIATIYGGDDYHVNFSKEQLAAMSDRQLYLDDKFSTTSQMESLLNIPILVTHGDQDQTVDVNLSRYIVRMLQRWDYNVRYHEVPGKGHESLGLYDQIVSWLLQYKRDDSPKNVRIRAADLRTASAYWVKVNHRIIPDQFIIVDAEVLAGNNVRIDSKNAEEIELSLPGKLVDYNKPVKIVWNGEIIEQENTAQGKIILKNKEVVYGSLNKNPQIAGPIADYQNTPFMIVAGTISKDSTMKKLILQKAEMIVNNWKYGQKYEPRFKKDVEVTDSDMINYTLFLLGGAGDNSVTAKIFGKIPFQIDSNGITIDGKLFKAKNAVLQAIYPNPLNPERYVAVAAANSGTGFYFFNPYNSELNDYDFFISDGKIPNYSAGAKDEKILIASGFFDNNWKMNKSFYNEGSEELRSKCANMYVNDDLSTKISGVTELPEELLKSYAGIYQSDMGFKIKIVLENGKLRASQVPGNLSFELSAVSESEFYLKEINLSIGFKKGNPANDYSMVIYEMGNEYSLSKVK
jgi:pimeloyl-ACP methyl ester carboxylesterase